MPRILIGGLALFISNSVVAQISPHIHVDQFGYLTDAEKVAVLSDPQLGDNSNLSYTPSAALQVRNSSTNNVIFTGSPSVWNSGNTHDQSGDKGWWFDFSSVTAPGTYHVYDGGNNQRSADFVIGDDVYTEVLRAAGRMFYYNRCNSAKAAPYAEPKWVDGVDHVNSLQDTECSYLLDPNEASLRKDLSGGWWDAGDYNKYVRFAVTAVYDLLEAWVENPQAFGDDWNIPESGNGIPDILDEVKWELDWVMKMTNADGSVHNKMGSIDYSHNTEIPPSNNTDRRYYGPTCTSASASVALMFAHAAHVLGAIPQWASFVDDLEATAILCYDYVKDYMATNSQALETDCDDGTIKSGDADADWFAQIELMITSEIYLLTLTEDSTAYNYFTGNWYWSTEQSNYYWSGNKTTLEGALLHYLTLPTHVARDFIQSDIKTKLEGAINGNGVGFWGWVDTDLYRAFINDPEYFWGSNRIKAHIGCLNKQMDRYSLYLSFSRDVNRKAAEQVHYFHGVNPLGLVYLTNTYAIGADRCVNEMYHGWFAHGSIYDNALTSTNGPPPGYLVGGPTYQYDEPNVSAPFLSPPYGEPLQKAYLDFNTSSPQNSWIVTEPAIYYQAAYVRLLANYVTAGSNGTHVQLGASEIEYLLSPSGDELKIIGQLSQFDGQILDAQGQVLHSLTLSGDELIITISDWPVGAMIRLDHKSNGLVCFQSLLKP